MADRRVTIAIKLHPEKDADLIDWWQGLERGAWDTAGAGVQATIKAALRAGIGYPAPPDERDELIDELRQQIDSAAAAFNDMRGELENTRKQNAADLDSMRDALKGNAVLLKRAAQAAGAGAEDDRVTWLMGEVERQRQWIDYLSSAVDGRVNVVPAGIPPQAQIEEVETIDEATERKRKDALKRANW